MPRTALCAPEVDSNQRCDGPFLDVESGFVGTRPRYKCFRGEKTSGELSRQQTALSSEEVTFQMTGEFGEVGAANETNPTPNT
jgi:hypothetical protein